MYVSVWVVLAVVGVVNAGLYPRGGAVKDVDAKGFRSAVIESERPSVVEFYAPWCGHCQKLTPEFMKAAKSAQGMVDFVAVNCDEDANKPLCQRYKVQGFPTIKTFRPPPAPKNGEKKKKPRPEIEDYVGERKASAIVEHAFSKMRNYASVVTSRNIDKYLSQNDDNHKVVLLAGKKKKAGMPPLYKALSVDFPQAKFGYVPASEVAAVAQTLNVDPPSDPSAPTLLLLPPQTKEPLMYEGELKRDPIAKFLTKHLPSKKASSSTNKPSPQKPKDEL
jgi:protein disulfide-isomerase A6